MPVNRQQLTDRSEEVSSEQQTIQNQTFRLCINKYFEYLCNFFLFSDWLMTEWLILFIFIVCLIICKIYVKQNIILFVIYLLMKNIICMFVPCSFKGGGGQKKGEIFFFVGGRQQLICLLIGEGQQLICLFMGGLAGPLIKLKKPYLGEPLSIFFREKGADPATDSLKN